MKTFRLLFLYLFLASQIVVISQIPAGYYGNANGLSGQELREALHHIIKDHITFPYTSTATDVWKILQIADRDPDNPENVIGIYSGFSMNGPAQYDGGDGWNREHVWPQSRGDFGTARGAGTDLHHLRAADISTNSARSNRFFDIAPNQYIDQSGQYSGSTNSYTSSHRYVFEPRDEVKGDIACILFYMVVRYEGTNGELNLELTDEILPSNDRSPLMGKASRLVEWHLADPVDDEERRRNDIVYSYQQNRNPFIDHPEFVCLILSPSLNGIYIQ